MFKYLTVLLTAFVMISSASLAIAAKGDLRGVKRAGAPLAVTLGKAELVDIDGAAADVLVADSSVVEVMAIQANRLYVVGLEVGDTNIIVLDDMGDVVKRIDVHVAYDLQAIQGLVKELYPREAVRVRSVHDQILLTGSVSSPAAANKIANLVGHYVSDLTDSNDPVDQLIANLLEVRGQQQVMLQVKILEASRNVLRELGIQTGLNDVNALATNSRGDSFALSTGAGIALSQEAVGIASIIADTGLNGIGNINTVLNALEDESLVNILAEPNLTAVSGQQAGFLAGGEFPVPTGRDQVGNLTIEFREFGVSLNFLPTVMSSERISLQMNTEVSSLDNDNAIVLEDTTIPGLDVRRADTTVEIASGNSLMIAGLLQSEAVKGMAGLPGISRAPVIGDLLSSDRFRRAETELIVIVTPYLVEPYADRGKVDVVKVEPMPEKQADNPL
ncbi:MAG: type II and III secretion system protein family protein, partial [Alphaproteobacteria bacterium]